MFTRSIYRAGPLFHPGLRRAFGMEYCQTNLHPNSLTPNHLNSFIPALALSGPALSFSTSRETDNADAEQGKPWGVDAVATKHRHGRTVSIAEAKEMPRRMRELPNVVVLSLAVAGDQEAREERLIREIMRVDNVDWSDANKMLERMKKDNRKNVFFFTLPYKVGIFCSITAALASFPLVFDLNTAIWFNEHFVTTEVPSHEDLETTLETGSWTWNWMEPPLGQMSFFLLCCQFARSQLQNHGSKPYYHQWRDYQAQRLCNLYPQYCPKIVKSFARNDGTHNDSQP